VDKTREFPLIGGVKDADRDAVFEEFTRFGEAFSLEGEGGLVFFEDTVDGFPRESGFLGLWTGAFP
jgi:hypothetical protein